MRWSQMQTMHKMEKRLGFDDGALISTFIIWLLANLLLLPIMEVNVL